MRLGLAVSITPTLQFITQKKLNAYSQQSRTLHGGLANANLEAQQLEKKRLSLDAQTEQKLSDALNMADRKIDVIVSG